MGQIESKYTIKYTLTHHKTQISAEIEISNEDAKFKRFLHELGAGNIYSIDYIKRPPLSEKDNIKKHLMLNRSPAPVIIRGGMDIPADAINEMINVMHKPMTEKDILFVPLDKNNYKTAIELNVAPEQEQFVGLVSEAIADAYFNPNYRMYAISIQHVFIGFTMFDPASEITTPPNNIALHRFLIDCHYQGRKFGELALKALINRLKSDYPQSKTIELRTNEDNVAAVRLYEKVGFGMKQEGTKNVLSGILYF